MRLKPLYVHPTTGQMITHDQFIAWYRTPMTEEEKEHLRAFGDFRFRVDGKSNGKTGAQEQKG